MVNNEGIEETDKRFTTTIRPLAKCKKISSVENLAGVSEKTYEKTKNNYILESNITGVT